MRMAWVGPLKKSGSLGEREMGGVGLREIRNRAGGVIEIGADGDEWPDGGVEASGVRSDVEHALAGSQVIQDFVHGLCLSGSEGTMNYAWLDAECDSACFEVNCQGNLS
jgi:hypothetical protein